MNECEHSNQITHINIYFEKMAVNLLLPRTSSATPIPRLSTPILLFWKPTVPGIWNSTSSASPGAAAYFLTFRLFHVIRNSFSTFCKIGMNTNKSNSSWSLLSGLKIPLIVMSVKKWTHQESLYLFNFG